MIAVSCAAAAAAAAAALAVVVLLSATDHGWANGRGAADGRTVTLDEQQ